MAGTLNSTRLRSQWSLDGKLLCLHVGIIRHKKDMTQCLYVYVKTQNFFDPENGIWSWPKEGEKKVAARLSYSVYMVVAGCGGACI
jgi:hypothetical protein